MNIRRKLNLFSIFIIGFSVHSQALQLSVCFDSFPKNSETNSSCVFIDSVLRNSYPRVAYIPSIDRHHQFSKKAVYILSLNLFNSVKNDSSNIIEQLKEHGFKFYRLNEEFIAIVHPAEEADFTQHKFVQIDPDRIENFNSGIINTFSTYKKYRSLCSLLDYFYSYSKNHNQDLNVNFISYHYKDSCVTVLTHALYHSKLVNHLKALGVNYKVLNYSDGPQFPKRLFAEAIVLNSLPYIIGGFISFKVIKNLLSK